MILKERSWFREDRPNLIGIKTVDKSVFQYGTQVPLKFAPFFAEANKKPLPRRGEKIEIILVVNGVEYKANFHNMNRTGVASDTFQIRYDGNSKLKELLREVFSHSFTAFTGNADLKMEDSANEEQPLSVSETMEFYATEIPMKYDIRLKPVEETKQDVQIWWVNQGSTIQAAHNEGIFFFIIRVKR